MFFPLDDISLAILSAAMAAIKVFMDERTSGVSERERERLFVAGHLMRLVWFPPGSVVMFGHSAFHITYDKRASEFLLFTLADQDH